MHLNEHARMIENTQVAERLHVMKLAAPKIAEQVKPGQFVHIRVPRMESHILRRPFSIYDADAQAGMLDILYQEVGFGSAHMAHATFDENDEFELIGPIGNTWGSAVKSDGPVLLVGGGVGSAPIFMYAKQLIEKGVDIDVVLGAQTESMLVTRERYEQLLGRNPLCSTDDGTYGRAGFATSLVDERIEQGTTSDGTPFAKVVVCGPPPLMKIVAQHALDAGIPCEVSLERRMACGIGACLSCVCDTEQGKKRVCVDGPIFDAAEVVW